MDPVCNPYSPGAGTPPPELAGRDQLRERVRQSIGGIRVGRPAKSVILVGVRGVGKTVLLNQMLRDAEASGNLAVYVESSEYRSLPAILAPQLRLALLRLSCIVPAKNAAITGLRALAGFAKALEPKFSDLKVGIDYEAEAALAGKGDLEEEFTTLLTKLGEAAKAAHTVLVIFVDELQNVAEEQLAALIAALHRVSRLILPVALVGAGLPQLRHPAGHVKNHAKRLFDYLEVGSLEPHQTRLAFVKPAEAEGVTVDSETADMVAHLTRGYPYFIQEWGSHVWDAGQNNHITLADVQKASGHVIAALDEGFFRVRLDRMTVAEHIYLRAMASLGEGPHRSGDIAASLGRTSRSLTSIRNSLISKGMIWSPPHNGAAFTAPLFDLYMCRIMPGDSWRSSLPRADGIFCPPEEGSDA
ncbi:ATP-binding protein [Pseudomonas aeruginosa]|uniref:ATP-binding protein n=1 Tax=Pseudomonas aeruginosa TaxID=287 RepID=UPI002935C97E|nr:ATP-binding protein [Pseudomonas aeruginosa]MDV2726433.1 ATP-binding protein [Pseudomonas aeruginosa]